MKAQHDTHRQTAIECQPGDMVWLSVAIVPSQRPSKKLDHKYLGPYKVVKKIGAYQLSSQGQSTRHMTFNEQYLKPFRKGTYPSQNAKPAPPAELINGEEEWEVEQIKDSRLHGRWKKLQFLVQWKGYPGEDSWENIKNVQNAPKKIEEFYQANPSAPRRIAASRFESLQFQPIENLTEVPHTSNGSWVYGHSRFRGNDPWKGGDVMGTPRLA